MILKCITKDSLINIELKQFSFKVVGAVPFDSKLGKEIIRKYDLKWLYNNRYAGVSPLDCVCNYAGSQVFASETITMSEFETMSIYQSPFNTLDIETVKINLDRYSGTIEHFSQPKLLGYAIDYFGTNLMLDVVVDNNSARVNKIQCNKMWKNDNYSDFYKKWIKDKANNKEGYIHADTFLDCISNYFMDIQLKSKPEHIAKIDSFKLQSLAQSFLKNEKDFMGTPKIKGDYEN